MGTASLVLSLFGTVLSIIGFVPFFGWINWFALILLGLGLLFGLIGLFPSGGRGKAVAGFVVSLLFGIIATIRLVLGLGVV